MISLLRISVKNCKQEEGIKMERESFKSRLGFILISAGCAIGIGNVWKFPYITGQNGGGAFVLFYLLFLIGVGIPIMTMEFAVGRAARKSSVEAFRKLEPKGAKWHWDGYIGMAGNYLLMMFYTVVSGWMLYYFYLFLSGRFSSTMDAEAVGGVFGTLLGQPGTMALWMFLVVAGGFAVCSLGLQKGVERITKWMMLALLALIVILAVHCLRLPGAGEGLAFYLVPDWKRAQKAGLFKVIVAAMNQSFFTLSLGIGSMEIFGSYLDKGNTLPGESVRIAALDTFVAITAGLIIFPACFSFGVQPDSGPSLVFITLPNVFNAMLGGRFWGTLFFLFMFFAAFSTVIAVFENIIALCMDTFGWSRKKSSLLNFIFLALASLPCVLGFNVWSGFTPFGAGSNVLDLEDFLVSNLLLPLGSLCYLLFCVTKLGWGFDGYLAETNDGKGLKFPRWFRWWFITGLPVIIVFLLAYGVYAKFAG
jgi:NSS family neurotransmitter:Na+ symporter